MKRIDTSTHAVDLFGPGKPGFRNGDLANGIAPTDFNADWPNGIQEEIASVIEAAGLTLNGADLTQLLQAIRFFGHQPGDVFYTARSTPPPGAIKANAAAVSRIAYSRLFAAIGTTYGAGDGVNTFNVPDARAVFIRGLDDGRLLDTGRVLGTFQKGSLVAGYDDNLVGDNIWYFANKGITDYGTDPASGAMYNDAVPRYTNNTTATPGDPGSALIGMSGVTRPHNVALLACIQY